MSKIEESVIDSVVDTYAKFAYAVLEGSRSFRRLQMKDDKAGKMSASRRAKEASKRAREANPKEMRDESDESKEKN